MQNIGGENAGDAFYRYKMPKLIAKIEGRGNGIKTNVVNNVDVAKALARPPEYILKFYGCELGAQTNYDKNLGTSIVNGAHDTKKLCELLESFIKKYVQCHNCGNPETVMKIRKECIFLKCKACGAVSDVDMRHKVNTFILKNPPENKLSKEEKRLKKAEEDRMRDAHELSEKKEKKEKKDKKDKKDKKKKSKSAEGETAENGVDKMEDADAADADDADESAEDEVVWMTDVSAEAVAARAAEQLTAATAALVTQGNIEAEKAEAKKRAKAEAKKKAEDDAKLRAEQLDALRSAADAGDKLDPSGAEMLLRSLLEEAGWLWANGTGGPAAISKVASGGLVKKLTVEGGVAAKARALYAALFTAEAPTSSEQANGDERPKSPGSPKSPKENGDSSLNSSPKLSPSITAAQELLAQLAHDAPGQLAQLVSLEWLLTVGCPDKVREAPLALKAIYDADLAEEDIILAWHARKDAAKVLGVPADGATTVRKGVQQVVEWLQEAESDEVSDEDDDDE